MSRWARSLRAVPAFVLAVALLAALTPIDDAVQDLVFRHVVSHEVRLLANGFTWLGTVEVAGAGLGALAIVAARTADAAAWQGALGGLAGIALGGLATQGVKLVGCRARPRLVEGWGVGPPGPPPPPEQRGFLHWPCFRRAAYQGFPSGHATTAFAAAAALAGWARGRRRALIAAAASVGASRVLLNAHFLSDVVAGALIGWAAGAAGATLAARHVPLPRRLGSSRSPVEGAGLR